jgi:hypothetical protein
MHVPVLFIIFNKREETKRVFSVIRDQRPTQLFIAADGPRLEMEGEDEKCRYVQDWVLQHIDWECDVKTLFRDRNIGCGRGPSEAISWFFEHVEEGIILEDDCLPNATFFRFSEDLLKRFRNNPRISMISGNNFQRVQPMPLAADYYFSVFPSSNGWATWKRSWQGFDYHLSSWPQVDKRKLSKFLFHDKCYSHWWITFFDRFYQLKPNDSWDYQFHYQCMVRNQLAIIPKANLVKNIGYGPDATHSQNPDSYFANVPTHEFEFPIRHPEQIVRHYEADLFIQKMLFGSVEVPDTYKKIKRLIKRAIRYSN